MLTAKDVALTLVYHKIYIALLSLRSDDRLLYIPPEIQTVILQIPSLGEQNAFCLAGSAEV